MVQISREETEKMARNHRKQNPQYKMTEVRPNRSVMTMYVNVLNSQLKGKDSQIGVENNIQQYAVYKRQT